MSLWLIAKAFFAVGAQGENNANGNAGSERSVMLINHNCKNDLHHELKPNQTWIKI